MFTLETSAAAQLLATIVGLSCCIALAIASRIGDILRCVRGRSLANFFGLTPGSRSSGEKERLGSITKQGSRIVRFMLGQLVVHVLRKDAKLRTWYRAIKKRRGAKIAREAVMRRMSGIMQRMLSKQEAYRYDGITEPRRADRESPRGACVLLDRATILAAYPAPAADGPGAGQVPVPLLCSE